jgi:hypothetical protein
MESLDVGSGPKAESRRLQHEWENKMKTGKNGLLVVISICLFIGCLAAFGGAGILVFLVIFFAVSYVLEKAIEQIIYNKRREKMYDLFD